MRPLLAAACIAAALTACAVGPHITVVCDQSGADDNLTQVDCNAVAEAVLANIGEGAEAVLVRVLGFNGCPPRAFCALLRDPPPAPMSALVGVRLADGSSVMRMVLDADERPMEVSEIGGYDADEFRHGRSRSAAGTLSP